MKKTLLLAALIAPMFATAFAEGTPSKTPVLLDQHRTDPSKPKISVDRAPMRLPEIEAYYDAEAQTLEVVADENIDATVTLEWNGQVINYSPVVNASFDLPTPDGLYTLYIEAKNWSATGSIEL